MVTRKKTTQSIFDKEFELDEKTKKAFAKVIKEARKNKLEPSEHSQTIICGPEEFRETKPRVSKPKR